jgi:RNA polymerase sigma-70 factor (ECF subfamily)
MSLRVGRHLAFFPIPADGAMEENKNMSLLTVVDHTSVPESKLLRLAREGNEEAFTELVRRHASIIYRISKRVLKDHEDAEDTLQNVLVKVHQRLDHFDGRSLFSTWLFRVTLNEALITLRRNRSRNGGRGVQISAVDDSAYGISNLPDLHESGERKYINRELALKAMLRLNPVLRCAFLLHKREGWTHRQMADEFGISVQTAKSRVFRARRQLREELEVLSR